MYGCDEVGKKIEEYIDNELSDEERKRIEKHIKTCASCSKELEFSLTVRNAVKEIKLPEPPADFLDRVYDKLNTQPEEHSRHFGGFFNWRSYSTIAACLLVAVFLGINADKFTNSMTSNDRITVGDNSAPPVGESAGNNMPEDLAFVSLPEDDGGKQDEAEKKNEQTHVTQEIKADTKVSDKDLSAAADNDSDNKQKKESEKKSIWNIFKHKQKESSDNKSQEPLAVQSAETPEATPELKVDKEADEQAYLYSADESAKSDSGIQKSSDEDTKSKSEIKIDSRALTSIGGGEIDTHSVESVPENGGADYSDKTEESVQAKNAVPEISSGGAAASGGGASAYKKHSDGIVYVSGDSIADVKNTAMHYGSYESGIFGMTAEKFGEFLSDLDRREIDYSLSFSYSGAVRFQIMSK